MSFKLSGELDAVLEKYPYRLTAAQAGILRQVAEWAHHEEDPSHLDGKRRPAKGVTLGPREAMIAESKLSARVSVRPRQTRECVNQLIQMGLLVRARKAAGGRPTTFRLPTQAELERAFGALPQGSKSGRLEQSRGKVTVAV